MRIPRHRSSAVILPAGSLGRYQKFIASKMNINEQSFTRYILYHLDPFLDYPFVTMQKA
ncbi:MAG: hypothetical protein KA010_04430 [Saprospiraceae bacterium]|nr:hypothetical protein [Saprospiraceae bacterium]